MFTKKISSLIRQLQEKKYRAEYKQFLVEGEKNLEELLKSDFVIHTLLITEDFFNNNQSILKNISKFEVVSQKDIENIGTLESNNAGLAIVEQKENILPTIENEVVLTLDNIRDPGNLGTIVRIADWYGIKKIIASESTVDFYNPKVVASSMGSFTRVSISYTVLSDFLKNNNLPVLGAVLNGENVHEVQFPKNGILLMGNESHGISPELLSLVNQKITIPSFGQAESLNVAIATAIILDNWKNF